MTNEKSHNVVRLGTSANPVEAHIWQQALEEAGIACKVVGDFLEAGYGTALGNSTELWVHSDDLAKAQEVLRERSNEAPSAEEDAED